MHVSLHINHRLPAFSPVRLQVIYPANHAFSFAVSAMTRAHARVSGKGGYAIIWNGIYFLMDVYIHIQGCLFLYADLTTLYGIRRWDVSLRQAVVTFSNSLRSDFVLLFFRGFSELKY